MEALCCSSALAASIPKGYPLEPSNEPIGLVPHCSDWVGLVRCAPSLPVLVTEPPATSPAWATACTSSEDKCLHALNQSEGAHSTAIAGQMLLLHTLTVLNTATEPRIVALDSLESGIKTNLYFALHLQPNPWLPKNLLHYKPLLEEFRVSPQATEKPRILVLGDAEPPAVADDVVLTHVNVSGGHPLSALAHRAGRATGTDLLRGIQGRKTVFTPASLSLRQSQESSRSSPRPEFRENRLEAERSLRSTHPRALVGFKRCAKIRGYRESAV